MKLLLSQLLSKLPLFLMLALTLMSFVLLQKTEGTQTQERTAEKPYDMDLYLKNFTIQYFDKAGTIKTQLQSASAVHSNESETLTLKPLSMLHRADTRRYFAAAETGVFSDDSSLALLNGRAHIQSIDPSKTPTKQVQIDSEKLELHLLKEHIKSNTPTRINANGSQSQSNQLLYDNVAGQMTLSGRVKATLVPQQFNQP